LARSPFFAILDALAGGSGSPLDASELVSGVDRMEESLLEAP
jgi:hypothetical protein